MAIIRLPQTKGEIQAAAAEIVYTARHDLWNTDSEGRHSGTSRVMKEEEIATDCVIEGWLKKTSVFGARESKALIHEIELSLQPWSEDVKKLGAKRVALVLSRRRWRGATSAASFLPGYH